MVAHRKAVSGSSASPNPRTVKNNLPSQAELSQYTINHSQHSDMEEYSSPVFLQGEFHKFNQLPMEVRSMVWTQALPGSRLIFLEWTAEEHFGHVPRVRSDVDIDPPLPPRKKTGKLDRQLRPRPKKFFHNGKYPDPSDRTLSWANPLIREGSMLEVMSLRSRTPPPALLSTCTESRHIAKKYYIMTFGTPLATPMTYFNFDIDTLVLPDGYFSKGPQYEHWYANDGQPHPNQDRHAKRLKIAQWRAPSGLEQVQSLCLNAYTGTPMVLTALRDNGINHAYFGGGRGHGAQSCRDLLTIFPSVLHLNLGALTANKAAWSSSVQISKLSESEISEWLLTRRLNCSKKFEGLEYALMEQNIEVEDFIPAIASSCASEHPEFMESSLHTIRHFAREHFNIPWFFTDNMVVAPQIAEEITRLRQLSASCGSCNKIQILTLDEAAKQDTDIDTGSISNTRMNLGRKNAE